MGPMILENQRLLTGDYIKLLVLALLGVQGSFDTTLPTAQEIMAIILWQINEYWEQFPLTKLEELSKTNIFDTSAIYERYEG